MKRIHLYTLLRGAGLLAPVFLATALWSVVIAGPSQAQTVNCAAVAAWSGNSVSYAVGALVTFEGAEYKCLQAHTSQPAWDPVDVPALWSNVGTCSIPPIPPAQTVNCTNVAAWSGSSVHYAVGALVTYQGSEFKCLQAHTSQPAWDPVDAPALWSPIGPCVGNINPPPFDWSDAFYTANGINVTELDTAAAGRFGLFRQTGPPAVGQEVNWKVDGSNTSPIHNDIRILDTVGGYDQFGNDQFITINAFANDQNFFNDDATGQRMLAIATPFQAYFAPRQKMANGQFAFQPFSNPNGTPIVSNVTGNPIGGTTNFFPTSPNATTQRGDKFFDIAASHYFCDDIIGMWLITYYYWLPAAVTNPPPPQVAAMAAKNGVSLDGTPLLRTPMDLDQMEGLGYADEYNLPVDGTQGPDVPGGEDGPVFLVCPTIPDASSGAIASDAFLDAVKTQSGNFLDPTLAANFKSLQITGNYSATTTEPEVIPTFSGVHTLAPENAPNMRLTVVGTVGNGASLELEPASGKSNQNWTFAETNLEPFPGNSIITSTGAGYPQTVPSAFYTLTSGAGNFSVDVPGGNVFFLTAGGAPFQDNTLLDVAQNDGSIEETWNIVLSADSKGGYFFLSGVSTDSRLDVLNGGTSAGTAIDLFQADNGTNQKWIIH